MSAHKTQKRKENPEVIDLTEKEEAKEDIPVPQKKPVRIGQRKATRSKNTRKGKNFKGHEVLNLQQRRQFLKSWLYSAAMNRARQQARLQLQERTTERLHELGQPLEKRGKTRQHSETTTFGNIPQNTIASRRQRVNLERGRNATFDRHRHERRPRGGNIFFLLS